MNRLILLLIGIALASSGLTILLWKLSLKKTIKYLPALLCLLFGIYYFYTASNTKNINGFEDLASLILLLMFFSGFVGGVVTGSIIDFLKKKF
ncbi:hypothetical protein DP73_14920 [Desulfosporosinus sp. HMP52]|nr:hypothetical protein DP73_14920 [Desulfosporosinus sp. HMP52]